MHESTLRVVLVDDHEAVRRLIRRQLTANPSIEVVAEAGSVAEGKNAALDTAAHVVVVDLSLPDGSGLQIVRAVIDADPSVRCVVMSGAASPEDLAAARAAGVVAYVAKTVGGFDLVDVVRRVAAGETGIGLSS